MSKGVKLLINALESTGKTTLTSNIENAMVVAIDSKPYPYSIPHYEFREFNGVVDFKNILVEKIKAYKEKYGKFPETVVIDTVTKLYELIYIWAESEYKGFAIHNAISSSTLQLNTMLDKLLVDRGINLVVTAHVQFDVNTNRFVVPATGQFAKSGSWMSIVDNASYLFIQGNERWIAHKDLQYPCRSTLDLKAKDLLNNYDVNEHISQLSKIADKTAGNAL